MDSIIDTISGKLKKEIHNELVKDKIGGIKEILRHEVNAKQYASAMFHAASEGKKIDSIKEDFSVIASTMINDKEALNFFNSNFIDGKIKMSVLNNVYKKSIEEETFNLLYILLERDLFKLLPAVIVEYDNICNEYYNIVHVKVTSAIEIKNMTVLENAIKKIAGRDIDIVIEIDSSLISGIIVEMEDVVYDYSLKNILKRLEHSISDMNLKEKPDSV